MNKERRRSCSGGVFFWVPWVPRCRVAARERAGRPRRGKRYNDRRRTGRANILPRPARQRIHRPGGEAGPRTFCRARRGKGYIGRRRGRTANVLPRSVRHRSAGRVAFDAARGPLSPPGVAGAGASDRCGRSCLRQSRFAPASRPVLARFAPGSRPVLARFSPGSRPVLARFSPGSRAVRAGTATSPPPRRRSTLRVYRFRAPRSNHGCPPYFRKCPDRH
jgi:hypothetical protein